MTNDALQGPPSSVDFLIVGAGPVGLLAANLAVKAGFTARIIDIEHQPNHWGRGDWIHGRTLELLESVGLAKDLLGTGVKVEKLSSFVNGKLQSSMPFVPDEVDSKHKYLLCVGQHITESTLQASLSNFDIQVERPATVTQIRELEKPKDGLYPLSATVMHMSPDGDVKNEEVFCKYLLGCDGAHSDIRHQLGISTDGETTETLAGVVDALVRTNFSTGRKEVCMIQGDVTRTVSLFPRENNLTRIFVHFDPRENEIRKEQHNRNKVQLEDIQREAKRALLPYRLEFLGVLYWSVYVVGQRLAESMSAMHDRVFLCGDAAHCQSPTLGQGVNTGFGDVFNLIWKISAVEKGQAKREILSSYSQERLSVAKKVIDVDRVAAHAAAGHKSKAYCDAVLEHRAFTSGFGIQYSCDNLLLSREESASTSTGLSTGMRAPQFKVIRYSDGAKTRLLEHANGWLTFSVIVLAGNLEVSVETVQKIIDWKRSSKAPSCVSGFYIVTTAPADKIPDTIAKDFVFIDKLNRAQCHTAYDVRDDQAKVVIVRPDGYIGTTFECFHKQADPIRQIQTYFDRISQ